MTATDHNYIFGPVPSRRLGLSLGVDIVPRKVCTLDCIYCQVGRTTDLRVERGDFVPVDAVLQELQATLRVVPRPDYITISGSGEPTLNWRLGEIIDRIRGSTDIAVAVITNGTLLGHLDVQNDCAKADLVCPSLDAGDEATYRRINRPATARGLTLDSLVNGLVAFRQAYQGLFWLEVFFLAGVNDSDDQVRKMKRLIDRIRPDRVQLNTATRPTAEPNARAVAPERLAHFAKLLGGLAEVIASFHAPGGKAGQTAQASGPAAANRPTATALDADAVLAMIRRRPVTADDIAASFAADPRDVARITARLEADGQIVRTPRNGKVYFEAAEKV